jgi:hypothetical protein
MMKRKIFASAMLTSCLLASGLFAAMDQSSSQNRSMDACRQCPPDPCPPPPCEPCCEPNPCCPTTPAYGYDVPCNFGILWEAGPRVCEGTDLFLTVDFIWWTAREDGLGYAADGINPSRSENVSSSGDIHYPGWEWDPGFKVGLGFNLPHDGWDIYAQYTWLHFQGDRDSVTSSLDSSDIIVPLWSILDAETPLTKATGRWDLHFNVIDVDIGRNFFVSQYLTLRPFVGFKGTWQHQDYKVRYIQDTAQSSVTASMRQDHDMWGIGLRTGVNFAWMFTRCFSLFSDWAISALMSEFDIDRKDKFGSNLSPEVTNVDVNSDFYTIKGVLEMDIGLRFEMWFGCNDAYHFMLQAAWEEQLWWNQNNMIHVGTQNVGFGSKESGDLMLHGLTIKARFDF